MSILRISLWCFLFSFVTLYAQQNKTDSLKNELAYDINDETKIALLSQVGMEYFAGQVYFDSAFFYVDKALILAKEKNLKVEVAKNYFNLASITSATKNHQGGIEYYKQVVPLLKELEMFYALSSAYNNIGANYFEINDYNKAIEYYTKGLDLAIEHGDLISQGVGFMNIGEVNFARKMFKIANSDFEKSLKILKTTEYNPPTVHLFYARSLFAIHQNDLALEQASMALDAAEKTNDLKYISESSKLLSDIFEKEAKYKEAYQFQKKHTIFSDSINEARELNEIEKLKLNFELKEKKEELAYLSQQTQYQVIIYILGFIGIVLLVVLISRQIKISKMTSNIHEIQRRLVEPELVERERRLKNKNATGFDAAKEQDIDLL